MTNKQSEANRRSWANRQNNGLGTRQNGAKREEVRQQISDTIRKYWEEGRYGSRVNGMAGAKGAAHPNWAWGRENFREILLQFEEKKCRYCGKVEEEGFQLDVHHIDEDHDNYLLSNLVWTCVPCHHWRFHYSDRETRKKLPFIAISKQFSFEYAHILPWHPGKCSRLHGHSGYLEVTVLGRLDPNGIYMDYGDLSKIVKESIIEPLDHTFLNEVIENPTSENFLIYAWQELELTGLKGLRQLSFKETDSSEAVLTKDAMVESFGWDRDEDGRYTFVPKLVSEVEVSHANA